MKPILITFFLSLQIVFACSQDTLTLQECYQQAMNNWPAMKEKALLTTANELKQQNIKANRYPNIDINGQATYQSDVISIDLPIPDISIPEPSKDQYKISVDINQVLFDGGITKSQKELEKLNLSVDIQQVEIQLYQLKERINKVYFTVLLLQENEKVLKIMSNEIQERLKVVESGVKNGIIMQSNVDILKAEQLKFEQKTIELSFNRLAAFEVLKKLINKELPGNIVLQMPQVNFTQSENILRPEHFLFDIQSSRINAYSKLISNKRNPKLFGFGQFGYGRPAFNFLSDDFDPFYIVGAKFTWNIWDWNQNAKERQVLSIQKDIIETRKETFDKNINLALQKEIASIKKHEKLIEKDKEIINLRINISKKSASQLENGVITSTDYLTLLNAETQSKINLESHKIQLVQAKINYLTINGN